jgi:hypothetical protein
MADGSHWPRPEDVCTPVDLAAALNRLRGGRSYANLTQAADSLPGSSPLPRSTLSDLLTKGRTSADTLEVFLAVCGVPPEQRERWTDAWRRAKGDFGGVRVTPEPDAVEAAPTWDELFDAWTAQEERKCRSTTPVAASPAEELAQLMSTAFSLVADAARLVGQMPAEPTRADPVAFGRFGAEAVKLSVSRLKRLPEVIAGTPAAAPETAYDDLMAAYSRDCRDVLHRRAAIMTARWPGCAVRLRLANPTEVDILGARVRLSLPDGVRPVDPALADQAPPGLPPRPVRREPSAGPEITLHDVYREDVGLVRTLAEMFNQPSATAAHPVVDPEARTVEFHLVDLRAQDSVLLPPAPLVVDRPAGTAVPIGWTVTGSAAHQAFSGTVTVPVVASTMPLGDLFPAV